MEEIAATYDYVNVVSIGNTYEGRDTKLLQIAKAGPGRPNIFIEGGNNKYLSGSHSYIIHVQSRFQVSTPENGFPLQLLLTL